MIIKFFASPSAFRKWLEANHATRAELTLGFHKKIAGKKGISYPEALDEALCFGWIDGVRRSLDSTRYSIRFTPRRARSIWSRVNLAHVQRLEQAGRMTNAGMKAYSARDPSRSGIYSFENAARRLPEADEIKFKADKNAWSFFSRQAPSYQRTAAWWVITGKKEETRSRRLAQLINDSAQGRRIAPFVASKPRA